ncbi:MAG: hypothetical protein R3Y59_04915 [bacterium]
MDTIKKNKINIGWWILAFVAIPFIVCILMIFENPMSEYIGKIDETHWLSFLGGYLGACITGLVTLYVLRITYNQNNHNLEATLKQNQKNHIDNQEQNRKLLQLQINTTKYNRAMQEIDNLKDLFDESYKTIDYQRLAMAIDCINREDLISAEISLMQINRDVEMMGNKFDLFTTFAANDLDERCGNVFRDKLIIYGIYVSDFVFIIRLKNFLKQNTSMVEFFEYVDDNYTSIKNISKNELIIAEYNKEVNIYSKLLCIKREVKEEDLPFEIKNAIEERLSEIVNYQLDKGEMFFVAKELLSQKERLANQILLENIQN